MTISTVGYMEYGLRCLKVVGFFYSKVSPLCIERFWMQVRLSGRKHLYSRYGDILGNSLGSVIVKRLRSPALDPSPGNCQIGRLPIEKKRKNPTHYLFSPLYPVHHQSLTATINVRRDFGDHAMSLTPCQTPVLEKPQCTITYYCTRQSIPL